MSHSGAASQLPSLRRTVSLCVDTPNMHSLLISVLLGKVHNKRTMTLRKSATVTIPTLRNYFGKSLRGNENRP